MVSLKIFNIKVMTGHVNIAFLMGGVLIFQNKCIEKSGLALYFEAHFADLAEDR